MQIETWGCLLLVTKLLIVVSYSRFVKVFSGVFNNSKCGVQFGIMD